MMLRTDCYSMAPFNNALPGVNDQVHRVSVQTLGDRPLHSRRVAPISGWLGPRINAVLLAALVGLGLSLLTTTPAVAQGAIVKLELIMGPGFQPADAHEWLRVLGKAGADDVKIRSVKPTDKIEIRNLGTPEQPVYVIYGELLATQQLRVPGRSFNQGQMQALGEWLDELRKQGIEGAVEEKLAFGLTSRALLELFDDLSAEVRVETVDQEVRELLEQLAEQIETPIDLTGSARRALSRAPKVTEEYQGLSTGTALAAMIRPLGLVAEVAKDDQGEPVIRIIDSRDAKEFWPIGWPLEESPETVAPELSEKIKVEINDFQLKQTLDAIEGKLGIRFLYDQNSLAAAGVDLAQVKVSYAHPDAPYRNILRRVLSQSRPALKYDLRLDENDVPFLWITTRASR